MYILPLLSLVLLNLFPQAEAMISIKTKSRHKFGSRIKVKFTNDYATATDYLGVFDAHDREVLWSDMCGAQYSWNTTCPAQTKGVVRFRVQDPSQESSDHFPINPGAYKVCLMEGVGDTELKCTTFRVKNLPFETTLKSTVTLPKTTFDYGETVSADLSTIVRVPSTWVCLYDASLVDDSTKVLYDNDCYYWTYVNCNSQLGNQPESGACSKKNQISTVLLNDETLDGSNGGWPAPEGTYKLCWIFFENEPYTEFVCSEDFDILPPSQLQFTIASTFDFSEDIEIQIDNPYASSLDWFALHDVASDPLEDYELFWSSMCGGQSNYKTSCGPQTSGLLSFKASDPDTEYHEQWPISPGTKKACLMNGDGYTERVVHCEDFVVEPPPDFVIFGSVVELSPDQDVPYDVPIVANFTTLIGYQNTWIGIYRESDVTSGGVDELPGEPLLWVYTACNNQQGDQSETNNCAAIATTGTITIDETSQERSVGTWPVDVGTYVLCMSLYNNSPYSKFVCSLSFDVI